MRVVIAVLAVSVVLAGVACLGTSRVLVEDSPYDSNIVSEKNPFAPERPVNLTRQTATKFLVAYEQTRLHNDLLSSRGYTIDAHDDVQATCTAISVNRTETDHFRVRLRCHGGIDDTKRLFEPDGFSYTVTYRIDRTTQTQLRIRGYPYDTLDELRPRPASF